MTISSAAILCGFSAALLVWYLAGVAGMGFLTWRFRGRFRSWLRITERDRADAALNVCFLLVLGHVAYMRAQTCYFILSHEWSVKGLARSSDLIFAAIGIAGCLWWLAYYLLYGQGSGKLWLGVMVAGAVFGAWMGSLV